MRTKRRREDFGNRVTEAERSLAVVVTLVALVSAYQILLSDSATFIERRRLFRRLFSDEPLTVVILTGWPVFWVFLSLIMIALMALSFLLDHYDRRFNERFYMRLRRVMLAATTAIIVVGVVAAFQQIWNP